MYVKVLSLILLFLPVSGGTLCVCITASTLNIRTGPSTSYSILGKEKKGECFEFISKSGVWSKLRYLSQDAYAHGNYLTDPCETACVRVTASLLNIRSCPSSGCSQLGTAPRNKLLKWTARSNNWEKVVFDGKDAYAHGNYLTDPEHCSSGGACFGILCSSNPLNTLRESDSYGSGYFGALRGSHIHKGVDVKCSSGDTIYAPIMGTVSKSIPYGDGKCCDNGFRITGTGVWEGYVAKVWYNTPDSTLFGNIVSRGQAVGNHIGLLCGCYGSSMTDHAHIQITKYGVIVNPTKYLINCN